MPRSGGNTAGAAAAMALGTEGELLAGCSRGTDVR